MYNTTVASIFVCGASDDDFKETTGAKRIVQALHAHTWPNLTLKSKIWVCATCGFLCVFFLSFFPFCNDGRMRSKHSKRFKKTHDNLKNKTTTNFLSKYTFSRACMHTHMHTKPFSNNKQTNNTLTNDDLLGLQLVERQYDCHSANAKFVKIS